MGRRKRILVIIALCAMTAVMLVRSGAVVRAQGKNRGLPERVTVSEGNKKIRPRSVGIGGGGTLFLKGSPITSDDIPLIEPWNIHGLGLSEHAFFIQLNEMGTETYWNVYCLDYGKSASTGIEMTGRGLDALEEPKQTLLSACLSFGFSEQAMTLTGVEKAKYGATQAMVWNIMAGIFNTETGDNAAMTYLGCVAEQQTAKDYYWQLKKNILSCGVIPGYAARNQIEAPLYELKWNAGKGKYEAIVEDVNDISTVCDFANEAGIGIEIKGSQVILTSDYEIVEPVLLSGKRADIAKNKCVMYWNDDTSVQRFGVNDFTTPIDNPPFYYKVKTEQIFGEIRVQKVDAQTNGVKPQGSVSSFEGTVYNVYNDIYKEGDNAQSSSFVDQIVIGADGVGELTKLAPGVYYVKEALAPQGYLLNPETQKVELLRNNARGRLIKASVVSKESIIRGDVEIIKFGQDKQGEDREVKRPLADVEFTVTSKTTGKRYVIKTDEKGYASTRKLGREQGNLLYDTYRLEETKGKAGYKTIDPIDVQITEEGQNLSYIIEDRIIQSALQIQKTDSGTGKIIPVSGTTFKILDGEGAEVVMHTYYPKKELHRTFETDETGTLLLPDKLDTGKYKLVEVKAPSGYLKGLDVEFEIENAASYEKPLVVTCADDNVLGRIKIIKTDAKTKAAVEGVTFQVMAKKDITTPDGTLRVKQGEIVDELTTREDGTATTKELFLGNYLVKEIMQRPGYIREEKLYEATLTYKDQVTPIVESIVKIRNKPTEVQILKKEKGKDTGLQGVSFSVWNKHFEIGKEEIAPEGAEALEEIDMGMVEKDVYTTDKEGRIVLSYLAPGSYCIQESSALPGYVQDDSIYELVVEENGLVDGESKKTLVVENDYTKVEISKRAVTSEKELPGAHLLVQDQDGELVDQWVSKDKPHSMTHLRVGETYYLIETQAPEGYELAETIPFQIENTGVVQSVVMRDEEQPVKAKVLKVPQTGDGGTNLILLTLFLILSCAIIPVCVKIAGKKE